jgi:hypothetical protein
MAWYTGTTSGSHYTDLLNKLINIMLADSLSSAAVSAAGTGYVVGDITTLSGGTFSPTAAKARVTSVGGSGEVTGLVIEEGGAYTVNPSSPASTTGGTGSGLTVSVTFDSNGWTKNMDNAAFGEREVWMEGTGAGSDEIHVGFKTFNALSQGGIDQSYNWGVVAATGHNGLLDWWDQPGISPGFSNVDGDPSGENGGAYVPLKTTDATYPIDYWISVTPRRVIVVAKVENATEQNYASLYVGFMNQFGTSSEYPYPIYVAGSSYRYNTHFSDTAPRFTGLAECMGSTAKPDGPAFYRTFDSLWKSVKNSTAVDTGSPSRTASLNYTAYPSSKTALEGDIYDAIVSDFYGFDWPDIIPNLGLPGTAVYRLQPTPNAGDDLYPMFPVTIVASEDDGGRNDIDVLGELDNVFWMSAAGGVSSEDYTEVSNTRYRIFQNGNRTEIFSYMAIKED